MPSQTKKRPSKRGDRKAKSPATIPTKFVPRFFDDADKRQSTIKEIRRRVDELRDDTGCNSAQKELLVRRAAFIALTLETQEVHAIEGKEFDAGKYVQAVNCLIGLLRCLGLERHVQHAENLSTYMEGKQ